jgi:RNA polymerase sigma factor (sigma-70 family)
VEPAGVDAAESPPRRGLVSRGVDPDSTGLPPVDASVAESFVQFFTREYPAVLRLAVALTGNRHAAEDVTQDSFLAAQRRWEVVAHLDRPGAWVRRVAVHRAASRWRRVTNEARSLARVGARPVPVVELPERDEAVWAAVRRLSPRQARVIALVYVEDRTVAETAAILGCSDDTVTTHLWRARRRLADQLRDLEQA